MIFRTGFWRKCRLAFRCFRFAVWAAILLVLGALGWFNLVGLPVFLKTRLVATLHERGVDLEFSRMRLRLVHGLVCDNVRVGQTTAGGANFTVREVQLRLDFPALLHRRLQLDGLVLRNGKFTLPVAAANDLVLTNLQAGLRFQANDTWSLDSFRAELAGARISLAGEIAHAPEARQWKLFAGKTTAQQGALAGPLKDFSDALQKIRFNGRPLLNATLTGDAHDVHSFLLRVNATVPGARTPWFAAQNLQLAATLSAPADAPTNSLAPGFWTNLQPFRLAWTARLAELRSKQLDAGTVECDGHWSAPKLEITRLSAQSAAWTPAPAMSVRQLVAAANLTVLSNAPAGSDAATGFWTNARPFQLEWTAQLAELRSDKLNADALECDGHWHAPELAITNLSARLGGGELYAAAQLDAATREVTFTNDSHFDPHALAALLPDETRARLAEVVWSEPPTLLVAGAFTLPPRNIRIGNWLESVGPTLRLHGELALTNTVAAGVPLDWLHTHFTCANRVWRLPDLALAQGRTRLALNGEISEATENFAAHLEGALDADSVRRLLTTTNAGRVFEQLTFRQPLTLALDARGNLRDAGQLTATGRVALADFAIRGQTVDRLAADVAYTNLTAEFLHPQLERAGGTQTFTAEKLTLDLAGKKLFFTGGEANVEPMVVARAIGPITARAMEPYQFLAVPTARIHGIVPLRLDAKGELIPDEADLKFDLVGTAPFRWRKFETPAITGTIHWRGKYLIVTNAVAETYGGQSRGWGVFDLCTPGPGTDFSFFITGTNADLNRMGKALWSPTNVLEGALSGTVTVTSANSDDWRTWNGFGELRLRDGLLWNVPIFGLLSPMLNAVAPGLGNNRAREATGRFTMTNGVIRTDSLAIQTATMQLNYVGTVDLEENVHAQVTALLMRNVPVIGPVASLLFLPVSKVFECEVTGTLDEPKVKPIYLPFPKLLLAPLHPFRSMEELFTPAASNAPAK